MEAILAHIAQFFHQTLGPKSGTKVVFLHGLLGFAANWRRIASELSDSYHILLFDQRGHGRSVHSGEEGYSLSQFAQDLALILDDLGWDEAVVVGHSLGGRVGLRFASLWPQRTKKLVIEDIGPEINERSSRRIESWLRGIPAPFPSRSMAEAYFRSDFPRMVQGHEHAATLAQFFLANMHQVSAGRFDWRVDLKGLLSGLARMRNEVQWTEWRSIRCPTLVMRGELSEDLPSALYHEMLRENPVAQGREFKGAGHWIHFEQPEAFIETLRTFLRL